MASAQGHGTADAVLSRRWAYNIADWPSFYGRFTPRRPALRFEGDLIDWGEFDDGIRRVAAALRRIGVKSGSRVGILLRNHPAYLETVFAAARIGAVAVPLNIRMAASELRDCVKRGHVEVLISEDHFADRIAAMGGAVEEESVFLVDSGGNPGLGRPYDLLREELPQRGEAMAVGANDPVLLMYTSGTSGRPKGALLTHGNVVAVAAGARGVDRSGHEDRLILPVPLAFCGPLIAASMSILSGGGTIGLERGLVLDDLIADLNAGWPTMLIVVPLVYEQLARHPRFEAIAFGSVRAAKTGGAPIAKSTLEVFRDRGLRIVGSYGLTEAGGLSTQLPESEAVDRAGGVGLPLPGNELRVVDTENQPVAPGEEGEVLISGPGVMAGYDGNPEATELTLAGGVLHTGDIGIMDEAGFLTIVDRRTDLILSGGLNVYPAEIERVLEGHPSITEVAVVGRPDERWGEIPVACVVSKDPDLDLEAIREFLTDLLADYKRPRDLLLLQELPRGMSGKVLKQQLRDEARAVSPS